MPNSLLSFYLVQIARRLRLSSDFIGRLEQPIQEYIRAIVRRRGFATREDLYFVRMQHKAMGDTMGEIRRLVSGLGAPQPGSSDRV